MNWKKIAFAAVIGAAAGYWITRKKTAMIFPEKALQLVKDAVKHEYALTGTWINVEPEPVQRFGLPFIIYRGGFSNGLPGKKGEHHEFLVDAKTGSLLELSQKSTRV